VIVFFLLLQVNQSLRYFESERHWNDLKNGFKDAKVNWYWLIAGMYVYSESGHDIVLLCTKNSILQNSGPTKLNGPKVFLFTKIKPEYSYNLDNQTHFPGPLVFLIRQVLTTCTIRHISLVPWFFWLDKFHCSVIYYF
jgi:hypothetical protein